MSGKFCFRHGPGVSCLTHDTFFTRCFGLSLPFDGTCTCWHVFAIASIAVFVFVTGSDGRGAETLLEPAI